MVWPTTPMVPPYREPPKLVNAPGAKEMVVPLGRSSVNDVPLFHAPGTRVSSVRPTMRLVPKLQPVETEEEALIRRQEWAAQTMDQSGISTIVHDPQTVCTIDCQPILSIYWSFFLILFSIIFHLLLSHCKWLRFLQCH